MKRGYNANRIYKVRCKSGLMGERHRIQLVYDDYSEFKWYAETYKLHVKLGYKTIRGAWVANPIIEHSVEPSDYRAVKINSKRKK